MKKFSIKHKVRLGYLAVILIMLVNAAISVSALHDTRRSMSELVDATQPLVLKLHEFDARLGKSSSALGTYLFTQADKQRIDYQNSVYRAGESLLELADMPVVQASPALAQRVAEIDAGFKMRPSAGCST